MNKSESINELATALAKAQSEIEDATKDKKGYNYKYADLSQILQIVRPAFSRNGLSITQFPSGGGNEVSLCSMLMHSSGQSVSECFSMEVEAAKGMTKAQASGSVITYMRRYALAAIAGITQEDNDAAPLKPAPLKPAQLKPAPPKPNLSAEKMIAEINKLLEETGTDEGAMLAGMNFGVSGVAELSNEQMKQALDALTRKKGAMAHAKK